MPSHTRVQPQRSVFIFLHPLSGLLHSLVASFKSKRGDYAALPVLQITERVPDNNVPVCETDPMLHISAEGGAGCRGPSVALWALSGAYTVSLRFRPRLWAL